jgi:hypothetical protein
MTKSAIDTLDHAMYTAMAEAGIANTALPSQSAFQDKPRRGPRL